VKITLGGIAVAQRGLMAYGNSVNHGMALAAAKQHISA